MALRPCENSCQRDGRQLQRRDEAGREGLGKCPTKIFLILTSQMRDLLREMVTEPLFWPLMLVIAGMFAYLGVTY
jgi:hypothetical protein